MLLTCGQPLGKSASSPLRFSQTHSQRGRNTHTADDFQEAVDVDTNYYDGGLRGLVRLTPSRNTPILTLTPAPTHPHTHRLVVVVSLRVAYGPLLSPVLSPLSPTPFTWRPAKESTVPSSNITGCDASESLIACLERVGRKELFIPQEALVYPPQKGAPAHIVPSKDTASVESDLMLLLPLLLLNEVAHHLPMPSLSRPCDNATAALRRPEFSQLYLVQTRNPSSSLVGLKCPAPLATRFASSLLITSIFFPRHSLQVCYFQVIRTVPCDGACSTHSGRGGVLTTPGHTRRAGTFFP